MEQRGLRRFASVSRILLVLLLFVPFAVRADQLTPSQNLATAANCGLALEGKLSSVARWLEQCGTVNSKADPETLARSIINTKASVLGVENADLALLAINHAQPTTFVRFQQFYQGIPVLFGQLVVQYDDDGALQLINNQTEPLLNLTTTPSVKIEQALATAYANVNGSENLRLPTNHQLVITTERGTAELAWLIQVYPQEPPADWHILVSATTNDIIARWDQRAFETGSGAVYHPNAVQETGNTGLRDNNDATSTVLDGARVTLALNNLATGVTTLKGSAVDLTAPGVSGCSLPYTPGSASSTTRNYVYTRDDDRFEEVTTYAAIDGVQAWFQTLGFTNANNRSIPVDVHCISADNSYFSSADNALHFGDGGVDDAEDADIVIHEYGHATQHNQVPSWGPSSNTEQRAMGEGFGDFLAGMYYIYNGNTTFLNTYRYCIGDWDAVSYNPVSAGNSGSGCLRWINGKNENTGSDIGVYSGTPSEEHDDGRYWAAALTCMYEGMGASTSARNTIMTLVIAHHFSLTPTTSNTAFEDAVAALRLADQTRYGGSHIGLINSCAAGRGLIPAAIATPTITAPTAGQAFPAGSVVTISWNTNGAPAGTTYTVEYSANCNSRPATWTVIGITTANTLNWTSPNQPGTTYCVRVSGTAPSYTPSGYATSGVFSLIGSVVPTPTITAPTSGQIFTVGSVISITWNINGAPTGTIYTVEYSDNCNAGTPTWNLIGTTTANALNWTAPLQAGTTYCVRVHGEATGYTASGYATSGMFMLTKRTVWVPIVMQNAP